MLPRLPLELIGEHGVFYVFQTPAANPMGEPEPANNGMENDRRGLCGNLSRNLPQAPSVIKFDGNGEHGSCNILESSLTAACVFLSIPIG